jgi:amino acid transporter
MKGHGDSRDLQLCAFQHIGCQSRRLTMSDPVPAPARTAGQAARVIIVGSVMFTFISYWRTAAVVLCDLGSTAYYIGGIVEQAVGPAAPWFILAVMLFSYAVRSVYIESCSLFIRGGVYRVEKEALGRFFAKIAVSALIFDYLLTGPISGVSAGHYLIGLLLDTLKTIDPNLHIQDEILRGNIKNWGAVVVAIAVTLYFYRLNVRGIHESSDRALKIMIATTVMVAIMIVWCGITLGVKGIAKDNHGVTNATPMLPDLSVKPKLDAKTGKAILDPKTGEPEMQPDPIGFLGHTKVGESLRADTLATNWWSIFGAMGLLIAFGHSILAMSGEETLAQVYREVEAPKLQNFRKAAFIVFVYSLVFTAAISFFAVWLIPQNERVTIYSENLISGLAMNLVGPQTLKLALNAFVVIIGFLILSGAVNTAIIGSNGVLNRVAEDGVLPEWFRRPHDKFGTTYRLLTVIVVLQLVIILLSQGNVLILGEAYAFGVVWSFVFQALAMVVLRFKDPRPREYRVPFNFRIAGKEIPFGLLFILFSLLSAALLNLFTKELATIFGSLFTLAFFLIFLVSEYYHDKQMQGGSHKHLEQFNQAGAEEITPASLRLSRPYRKLVAIRSPHNLFMLEKALEDTNPESTDLIVMTAKSVGEGGEMSEHSDELDSYDQELMTAVVQKAEMSGKQVHPLIVPTNNPLYALLRTAKSLNVQELIVGASNKYTADEQLEQVAFHWITLCDGKDRDVWFDLGGGSRIPRAAEAKARSVADLRRAGIGVDKVMLVHHDSSQGMDLFQSVLTMLDPQVDLVLAVMPKEAGQNGGGTLPIITEQSEQLSRTIKITSLKALSGEELVAMARLDQCDAIIVPIGAEYGEEALRSLPLWMQHVLANAPCRVLLTRAPSLPTDLAE